MDELIKEEPGRETLPIEFLTQFISTGWEEVGRLKAEIDGIKAEFSGTDKVVDILQSLVDQYLICLGQTEAFMHDTEYVDIEEFIQKNYNKY